jgi:hypothetical protein
MSNNNYFFIFKEDTIKLCKSMVIKSQKAAEAINIDLSERGYTPEAETHRWKYFLNLDGVYHTTDVVMTVTSLDTLETINFTKANLELHKTTRKEYTLQSGYYEKLVLRFPEQEELIRGIINPVDVDTAVNAEDFTILNWDKELIEVQEENLIPKLQMWVRGYAFRYSIDGYSITDNLYISGLLGVLYLNLPVRILNIRLGNCHTEMVHTYHIWSYLSSHSAMDDFKEYLTYKQAHYLYRNIRYLEANVGKDEVFQELVKNLLTERGLSLYGHRIEHVVDDILVGNNKPKARIRRSPINSFFAEEIERTVSEVLVLEEELALWNTKNHDRDEKDITSRIIDSARDSLPTKVMESEAVDLSGSLPITLGDVLLNHWLDWAATGRLKAYVSVSNPFTNNTMRLSSKDSVIAFFYCYNKSHGRIISTMPDVFCERTVKQESHVWTDALKLLDSRHIDEGVVEAIVASIPSLELYTNPDDFYIACEKILDMVMYHRYILGSEEDFRAHGEYAKAIDYCFRDYRASYGNIDVDEWMIEKGLSLDSLSASDAEIMANDILAAATGADANAGQSLKELQAAMLGATSRLCSYDLQFIQTTNEVELKRTDWPTVKSSDKHSTLYSKITQDPTLNRATSLGKLIHHVHNDHPLTMMDIAYNDQIKTVHSLTIGVTCVVVEQSNQLTAGSSAPVRIKNIEEL